MVPKNIKQIPMSYEEVARKIDEIINTNSKISVITHSLPNDTERKIDIILEKILEKYGKQNLKSALYTATKELTVNGTKANMKAVFFEENGWDINNPDDYTKGTKKYKQHFSEKWAEEYGRKSSKMGRYVKLTFSHTEDGLCIEVINNSPISDIDEKRLREKLSKTMTYEDIVQFYMEQSSEADEGAGMGIALIIMLLKGEGIDPYYFRIFVINRVTKARIEIPFTSNYVFIRNRRQPDKKSE